MKIITNRTTPLEGLTVPGVVIMLDGDTVDKAFWKRLVDLTENMFIREDEVFRVDGAELERKVGHVLDKELDLPVAAIRLKKAILDAAI